MAKNKAINLGADHLASQERGAKFKNSAAFNPSVGKLGADSQPGRNPGSPGAPLVQNRKVDDFTAVTTRYADGINPYGLIDKASAKPTTPTMVRPLTTVSPAKDSPVPLGSQHPDLAVRTKADEVRAAEGSIGKQPSGVLGH